MSPPGSIIAASAASWQTKIEQFCLNGLTGTIPNLIGINKKVYKLLGHLCVAKKLKYIQQDAQ